MKTCILCKKEKPLEEFYKHPQMKDGRLGKCIECSRAASLKNRAEKIEYYREFDKKRANEPHRVSARIEYQNTERGRQVCNAAKKRYYFSDPRKTSARILFSNAVRDGKVVRAEKCERCNNSRPQGHHESYDKPLEVTWLCSGCHATRHKEMRRDGIAP